MNCYKILRIDPRSITPVAVTFAADTLTINLPQMSYNVGGVYFLRLTEPIPDATTINAPVVITIGDGTVTYPLLSKCGGQVTAASLRSGYSYPVTVVSGNGGAFKVLDKLWCAPVNAITSVDGTADA